MRRLWIAGLLLAFNGCIAGCVSPLDTKLMEVRAQALANQELYAVAEEEFAKLFEANAEKKATYQHENIAKDEKLWLESHVVDGKLVVDLDEFATYTLRRDTALLRWGEVIKKDAEIVSNFRKMSADNQAFLKMIYGKEVEAEAAKQSLAASVDSVLKFIAGGVATAVPFLMAM